MVKFSVIASNAFCKTLCPSFQKNQCCCVFRQNGRNFFMNTVRNMLYHPVRTLVHIPSTMDFKTWYSIQTVQVQVDVYDAGAFQRNKISIGSAARGLFHRIYES